MYRSAAEEGSWGSERDTSYQSFDEEAYSSFNSTTISIEDVQQEEAEGDNFIDNDDAPNEQLETKEESGSILSASSQPEDDEASEFKRGKPTKRLLDELEKLSGTREIGEEPNKQVLNSLSRRDGNQLLRFEYLGMFPFRGVFDFLLSIERKRSGRGGETNGADNGLPRILMVAEKPSIAKAIAEALSKGRNGFRQRRGISRALPVYEFTADAPFLAENSGNATRAIITVTSVVGHVFSLGFVEEEDEDGNRRRAHPSEYFHFPVVKQEEESTGKLRVVDHLRALAAESDHLVLWLDCDAEGKSAFINATYSDRFCAALFISKLTINLQFQEKI